jgi:hypothetical protein
MCWDRLIESEQEPVPVPLPAPRPDELALPCAN